MRLLADSKIDLQKMPAGIVDRPERNTIFCARIALGHCGEATHNPVAGCRQRAKQGSRANEAS
jgi:hypothetical protein